MQGTFEQVNIHCYINLRNYYGNRTGTSFGGNLNPANSFFAGGRGGNGMDSILLASSLTPPSSLEMGREGERDRICPRAVRKSKRLTS